MDEQLKEHALTCVPVGSRVTCNPPPTNTDEDWLCYVKDVDVFVELAIKMGYYITSEDDYEIEYFTSMRKEDVNLIITQESEFFNKFICASNLAKRFNLLHKDDRIALFQGVLYANVI